jgi:ABC-2 type transport system permease protein
VGFVLYAIMFAAAGALAGRPEDAQNLSAPMSLLAVAGFMASIFALDDPESTLAVVGSLVPFTAPFMVPVRASLGAIPVWEYGLSIVITLGSIAALTMIGGRIYAGGLLRFGSRTKISDAWSSGRD